MRPQDHYQAGDLQQAIAAAKDEVRKSPADTAKRGFLCELLCFAGDWEGADRQLDTLGQQDPDAAVALAAFRHLIRAEQSRQQFYADGRLPEFLDKPSADRLRLNLEASICIREGQAAEAARLLGQAEEQRPHFAGVCNGQKFDDLRDLDDLTASFFEVLTSNGKYYWIPIERVELLEMRAPTRPHDLLWRRAHMVVTDGPDGEVFIPAVYAGTGANGDDRLRLGRATDWRSKPGEPTRGFGQRTFLVGEDSRSIMEIETITTGK
jgi:type VI secretion system protein ImpE